MPPLLNDKEIKKEITEHYCNKENDCIHDIEVILNYLDNRFKDDQLPASTNHELCKINSFEITENLKIPSPLQIGELHFLLEETTPKPKAFLDFVSGNGICIELNNENNNNAHQFLQNIGLKVLLSINQAVANVIVIDPQGNGSNFKLLLGYDKARPNLVLNKAEIGPKLSEVLKSFNKLQMENLTFKYDSLEDLNINEPKLTKPYTFIFISNFPFGFKKEDRETLEEIISKGTKYGTFVFMSHNPSIKPEWSGNEDCQSVLSHIAILKKEARGYKIYNSEESAVYNNNFEIQLDEQPSGSAATIISFLNNAVKQSSARSVTQDEYLEKVLAGKANLWSEYSEENERNAGVQVSVGLKSATEELQFTIDCGTDNYHAIIGGKTGSGKTVLLDNIIVNAGIKYSPQELQFILLDFKGASFQKYRNLPHLRILFGGNDRNYGLNVLRFLDDENTRRQAILAGLGGKLSALNKADRIKHNMPRFIIILDEFQVLLKEVDSITREANRHIDTIAQQGRSAGMHLILSSQDLTGITISDSAQFNSNVRIALQMDPNACKQIFSMDNLEASLLEKKGEAVYNEKPGRPRHGNQRFQVFKLEDETTTRIVNYLQTRYRDMAGKELEKFILPNESNASITNNPELVQRLFYPGKKMLYPKVYLGEPSFIKVNKKTFQREDAYMVFKRAENSNLLIAGNDMNTASKVLGLLLIQLLKLNEGAKFKLLNNFGGDKIEWRERFKELGRSFGDSFVYHQKSEANQFLTQAEDEITLRKTDEEACSVNYFLFILNLDSSFQKQGFTVSEQSKRLLNILKTGPDQGVHTVIYSYSGKSVVNSGIEHDLFETKIVVRGDSKDIVKIGEQRELVKEKMIYLYAPPPVTSINPDLINVYTLFDEEIIPEGQEQISALVKTFMEDFNEDE
ncbi:MAG: hypothetical protein IPN39_07950 [Chitinophagaceae bacterium]|nr:hypothetical protein [Chitinophagaceae bacterium]